MRFIRDNFPYVILGLVALVLIFITISLQTALSGTQDPATTATGSFAAIRAQLASWIAPGTGEQPEPLAAPATTTEVANAAAGNNAVSAANDLPTGQTNASPINSAEPSADNAASSGLTGMAATLYGAENLTVSEDDEILAAVIADTPTAIGFFGYAYYLEHQDRLRTIAVRLPDGQIVGPNAVSVANGLYPLARPLYLYTSPSILREKPQVERFIGCYLNRLPQAVTDVGYLLPSRALFDRALQSFSAACQWCRREALSDHLLATTVPVCDFTDVRADAITVVGSSTVKPISERMATIVAELGFGGEVTVDGSGTGAGFKNFCGEGVGDIVDASRPIKNEERAACNERGRAVLPFPVGVDALAIVVSRDNSFVEEASIEELQQIFAYARRWSDIHADWPDTPILRVIPGSQSGTFDYFVEAVMEEAALAERAARLLEPLSDSVSQVGSFSTSTPTTVPVGSGAFVNNRPDVRVGYVDRGDSCLQNSQLAALIMARKFGLKVTTTAFPDAEALFRAIASKDAAERIDLTFCYVDPLDRTYRQKYFSYTEFIGSGYQSAGEARLVIMSNSAVKSPLERTNSCFYRFLTRLNWNDLDLGDQEPTAWYDANLPTIDSWTQCD